MIKNYQDFINESLELILESDVVFSDNFRKIIKKIESPIAKKLIEIENQDLPVRSNYFDIIPAKNDKVSFLDDRRAQDILKTEVNKVRYSGSGGWLKHTDANKDIFDKLGYTPSTPTAYEPNTNDVGEVVKETVSETSGNTYCWVKFSDQSGQFRGEGVYNKQRLSPLDDRQKQIWSRGRQEIAVGRGIRAILATTGEKFLDKDIEQFVNLYKAQIDKFNDKFQYFEVVTGRDIAHWYHNRNYYEKSGQLGNSCMASAPEEWLEIYTENPNQVALVIYKSQDDTDKIIGRALLWTLDDGKKFMDRIYTNKDSDIQLFRDYAKENGWYVKYHNSSTTSSQAYAPDGSTTSLALSVTLSQKDYDHFPYLDTLKYYTPYSGNLNNNSGDYTLEDTGGEYVRCDYCGGSGTVECGDCDGRGEEQCYDCSGDGTVDCDDCNGSGEVDCSDCDGTGKKDCTNCDGSGNVEDEEGNEVDCDECGGSGETDCSNCHGNCTKDCSNCDNGRISCSNCDGAGEFECNNCDGRGEYSCPEC